MCVYVFGNNCCERVYLCVRILKKALHVCEIQDEYALALCPVLCHSRNKKDISSASSFTCFVLFKQLTNLMSRKSIVWESECGKCTVVGVQCAMCESHIVWLFRRNLAKTKTRSLLLIVVCVDEKKTNKQTKCWTASGEKSTLNENAELMIKSIK